jgi:tetratricopeptide (TPR) repeat protein
MVRAQVLLLVGDEQEYERHCDAVMKRFGPNASAPDPLAVAYVWSLSPHALRGADWNTLIDRAMAAGPSSDVQSDRFVIDLAHYRNRQWQQALDGLGRSAPINLGKGWVVLAMVHHQLGQAELARGLLGLADRWYEQTSVAMASEIPVAYPATPWWEWAQVQVLRREAKVLIEGKAPADHPLLRLHYARSYARLGATKEAEAEFKAAVDARPGDTVVWQARARVFSQLGWHDRAEADLGKAPSGEQDAQLRIARGRLFAERGMRDRADGDYAEAAARSPNAWSRFLDGGWWVVGPYPKDLTVPWPPEQAPDPSRPVSAVVQKADLRWRWLPSAPTGELDLGTMVSGPDASAYALNHIWSTEERTATLLLGGSDYARVWLNGHRVADTTKLVPPHSKAAMLLRVPVTLRAGRNTVLAHVTGDITPCLRLVFAEAIDSAGEAKLREKLKRVDRATEAYDVALLLQPNEARPLLARSRRLEELTRQKEADADFARAIELRLLAAPLATQWRVHATRGEWRWAMICYSQSGRLPQQERGTAGFEHACLCLLTDDTANYRRTLATLLQPAPDALRFLIARTCTLSAESAKDLPRAIDLSAPELEGSQKYYHLTVSAGLRYRACRYEEAAKLLRQCLAQNPMWDGQVVAWLWLAMTCERLGQKAEASYFLDMAERWLRKYRDGMPTQRMGTINIHVHDWLEAHVLLREAKALITRVGP